MKPIFEMLAGYDTWANQRLYAAVAELPDTEYRADHGAFFGSVHGTLNHLLVGDRIWMHRFTGEGPSPQPVRNGAAHAKASFSPRAFAYVPRLDVTAAAP